MKLLGFQRSGVAFLVHSRRALLADPPGTGKTGQLIRTLQVLQEMGEAPFPALVVCPNSLKTSTWARQLQEWAPEIAYQVVDGDAAKRRKQLQWVNDLAGGIAHLPHCATRTVEPKRGGSVSSATWSGTKNTSRTTNGANEDSATCSSTTSGTVRVQLTTTSHAGASAISSGRTVSRSLSTKSASGEPVTSASCAPGMPESSTIATPQGASEGSCALSATQRSTELTKISIGSTGSGCTCSQIVAILNWEAVRLHSRLAGYGTIALTEKEKEPKELNLMGLRTVILDEAHKGKDPTTAQTRAVWAVLHDAEFRFLASGTPVADNIGDLWALGHGIEPEWFPGKVKFLDYFATTSLNSFGGLEVHGVRADTNDQFFKIIDPLMRRIPKEAALPFLPPVLPVQIRHTVMGLKQKKAYDEMERDMIAQLNDLLVAPNPLAQLMRLNQFASACGEVVPGTRRERQMVIRDGELTEEMVEYETADLRLTSPSAKVDDLVELLEEMGPDEPLVVAAVSRQLIELAADKLKKVGISFGLVTGAQSQYERDQAVQMFQNGQIRVIMLTLGAGAEGLTLTRSRTMLFMQESYSEIQNAQARDRVHRIGSERHDAIRIIKQVTPGTVEERRDELLQTKQMRMEEVVRDRQTLAKLLGAAA